MKKYCIVFILFSVTSFIFAQTKTINGIVLNKKDNTFIEGANIKIQGSSQGVITNSKGEFSINEDLNNNVVLIISHIGYLTNTIEINTNEYFNKSVNIYLTPTVVKLGEAIVTSTKYQKQVKDVPLPLELMEEHALQNYSPNSISDVLENKPGLTISRDGAWGTLINIRGLSKQNVVKLIDGNRIETGTNIAAGMSLIDVNDIERIEVIKGASSSLYGSGALGGVVNIITKKIGFKDSFYFNGKLSSGYNSVNNLGVGNLNLFSGGSNWYAKISTSLRSANNTETPEGILDNSQFKDNNISANIGFAPLENHELDVKYQRFYAEDVGIPGGSAFPSAAKATYPEELREMYSVEYKINNLFKSMSNISLKYFNQVIERRVELIPNANAIIQPNADHETNGIQMQTNWILGKSNILIAGIDAWQRNLKTWRIKNIIPKNQIVGETPVPESDYRSIGIFVQDEMQLIENKLHLSLGGRIDQIKVTNEEAYNPEYIIVNGVRNDSPPTQVKLWDAEESEDISASANVGLLYNLTDQLDITFNFAQSFRSPSLEERYQYIALGVIEYWGNSDLEPEKGTFMDLGFRVWNPKYSFSGNVFTNFLTDLVIDEYQNDTVYVKNNVGKSRFMGFDFSFEYNFYSDFVIYGSGAYIQGEDTENNVDLPEIPPLNGQLGIRLPIAGYATADLRSTFYNDQENVAVGETKTAGYGKLDFYAYLSPINISMINLNVAVGVENIFDKAYRNHLSTYRGVINFEPGRNFFAKISLNF